MSCIMELGVAGIVVGLASVLPHGLLYGIVTWMISSGNRKRSYYKKSNTVMNVGTYLFIILVLITGCIIESLIGTHFIPWVIRLSMI